MTDFNDVHEAFAVSRSEDYVYCPGDEAYFSKLDQVPRRATHPPADPRPAPPTTYLIFTTPTVAAVAAAVVMGVCYPHSPSPSPPP